MMDVRLRYDTGLDKYYVYCDLAVKRVYSNKCLQE